MYKKWERITQNKFSGIFRGNFSKYLEILFLEKIDT